MVTIEQAFAAFAERVEERGPTARELVSALGLKNSSEGAYWLTKLEAAALIERTTARHTARGYRLTAAGKERLRFYSQATRA